LVKCDINAVKNAEAIRDALKELGFEPERIAAIRDAVTGERWKPATK